MLKYESRAHCGALASGTTRRRVDAGWFSFLKVSLPPFADHSNCCSGALMKVVRPNVSPGGRRVPLQCCSGALMLAQGGEVYALMKVVDRGASFREFFAPFADMSAVAGDLEGSEKLSTRLWNMPVPPFPTWPAIQRRSGRPLRMGSRGTHSGLRGQGTQRMGQRRPRAA